MAELLLSDYGATANDSTSCSSAFNSAVDDLEANDGGSIAFDMQGVCRNTAKVETAQYMPFRFQGYGDNPIRLMALGDRHFSLTAQQETVEMSGMVFLGALGTFGTVGYSTNSSGLYMGGAVTILRNTKVLGVTSSSASGHGSVTMNNSLGTVDGCIFNGSAAVFGVLVFDTWRSACVKNSEFLDYATWGGGLYSRTPDVASAAWIRLSNAQTPYSDAQKSGGLTVENCVFDEGAGYSVYMDGGQFAHVLNCKTNVGTGSGYYFEDVSEVRLQNVWIGYSTSGSKKGITLKDVSYARLDGVHLMQDVDYIEISGTTQKVDIYGGDLNVGNNATYPTSIYNPAGAEVRINGIRQVNGLTQIG